MPSGPPASKVFSLGYHPSLGFVKQNAMDTPWGPLSELDHGDQDLALRIIKTDKDTLVDGLIVEHTFDKILRPLTASAESGLTILNIETIIVSLEQQRIAFVWARSRERGLGRYLLALAKGMPVYLIDYADGEFFATPFREQHLKKEARLPLTELASSITKKGPNVREVSLAVRDARRTNTAYWGFLDPVYKDKLWDGVILARLLINHGLSPYFHGVWNLDRVCLYQDKLWVLEIKHKFPMKNMALGINVGEVQNIAMLHGLGIECLYTMLVNPVRKPRTSAMYLYNNRELQEQVAVIAMNLGVRAKALLATEPKKAPSHTSISGNQEMDYYQIRPESFSYLGSFADPMRTLGKNLLAALDGETGERVRPALLDELSERAKALT